MIGIYLVAALVALALLLSLNVVFKSMMLKLALITYTFAVASIVYFSFDTYKGWPTTDKAETGQILSISVVEPRGKLPGAIYFWALEPERELGFFEKLYTYRSDLREAPRGYWVPYTKQSAKQFREAQEAIENGMVVMIEGQSENSEQSKGDGEGEGDPKEGQETGDSIIEDYKVPHLKIVPPDSILKKG